ncbi:chemotaxis protein CheD [Caldimonas brevitalea]|uniref:Probable chemoreceptor glutamine deamidase CheD n=1 Tax=Caldimonas brevitalea TaxID=413882 RepID=A0A0G3BJV4_9BURK|nr:chemotaxis protein CheD [Caldimonas brevitalea]
MKDVTVQPGEVFIATAPQRARTLLGSCVAVTLWHPLRRIGAMSHFLLPRRATPRGAELDGRYGDEALDWMVRELSRRGVVPRECEAKLFGGGSMFPRHAGPMSADIGRNNGEAARLLLAERGIAIVSEDLFGVGHRQIVFDLSDGSVWSRRAPVSKGAR